MARRLPPRANLKQLKHQAKDVLRACANGEKGACATLRGLRRFAKASDKEILAGDLALHEAQYALAMEYGFSSWDALKKHVESLAATGTPGQPARNLEQAGEIFDRVIQETCEAYWQPRSYIYSRLVCMKAAGWADIDYETLMPISGFGISFAYHPNEKFYVHYTKPPGADQWIAEATGFGWQWLHFDTADDYWDALKATLDVGKVIHAPWLEEILFIGYQEASGKADRQVSPLAIGPVDIRAGESWAWLEFEKWFREHSHGFLGRHTEAVPTLPAREMAVNVMKNIVTLAHNDPRAKSRANAGVHFGLAGIEAYANDIADLSKSGKKDEYFQAGWLGCHNIYPQWTARQLTGQYLKGASEQFEGSVRAEVLSAAKEYDAAHAAWKEWESHLGAFEKVRRPEDAWENPEHRKAGAAAVYKALEREKAAIPQIEKALAAIQSN